MKGQSWLLGAASATALLLASSSAFAINSLPMGWYIDANAGSTDISNTNYPGSVSNSGTGVSGDLGYKFMPYLGMEFGYTYYANTVIKNGAGTKAGTVKNYSYDIAGKGILPLMDTGFELFAKLGASRVSASTSINSQTAANGLGLGSSSHSKTGLYFGGGAAYYFFPEFGATIQWMRAQGDNQTGDMDLISAGLEFIIG